MCWGLWLGLRVTFGVRVRVRVRVRVMGSVLGFRGGQG